MGSLVAMAEKTGSCLVVQTGNCYRYSLKVKYSFPRANILLECVDNLKCALQITLKNKHRGKNKASENCCY